MAPKKDMMAVLEYWQGYLLPMLDCRRNQEDQESVPMTRAIVPTVHLSAFLAELRLIVVSIVRLVIWEWSNRDGPL